MSRPEVYGPVAPAGPTPEPGVRTPSTAVGEISHLLRTLGQLLRRYAFPLLGIAAAGVLGQYWWTQLAIVASRADGVGGMLVFALVPAIAFGITVWMFAILGRRAAGGVRTGGLGLFGSALLIYLLIYEQDGRLTQDTSNYLTLSFFDALFEDPEDALERIPDADSGLVITIVAIALAIRLGGAWLLEHWPGRHRPDGSAAGILATSLRILVGYAEIVWLVLAVASLARLFSRGGQWWNERAVVSGFSTWWRDLNLPDLTGLFGAIGEVAGNVLAAVVIALLVPLAWLTLATMLYGSRFADLSGTTQRAARFTAAAQRRVASTTRRLRGKDDSPISSDEEAHRLARLERSWDRLAGPEGRWDALAGSFGLVLAVGWLPLLALCLLLTLTRLLQYPLWWVADTALLMSGANEWRMYAPGIDTAIGIIQLVLTVALAAAAADRALTLVGAPTVLRISQRPGMPSTEKPIPPVEPAP